MVDILALISSILFTPAFSISYFYETGVKQDFPASATNHFFHKKEVRPCEPCSFLPRPGLRRI